MRQLPEEVELERKRAELAILEFDLVQKELVLANLVADLRTFEREYLRIVGTRLAELDEIEAQIAEADARSHPEEEATQQRARQRRDRADETAQATAHARQEAIVEDYTAAGGFQPPESLVRLYREVAKCLHPDLTANEHERSRRTRRMALANKAYADRDELRLRELLAEEESSPEAIQGEGPAAELVRVIRKIAQVQAHLRVIGEEIMELEATDLHRLKTNVEEEKRNGSDALARMAKDLDRRIAAGRQALAHKRQGAGM